MLINGRQGSNNSFTYRSLNKKPAQRRALPKALDEASRFQMGKLREVPHHAHEEIERKAPAVTMIYYLHQLSSCYVTELCPWRYLNVFIK